MMTPRATSRGSLVAAILSPRREAATYVGIRDRSPDNRYRTAPLNGLFAHQKGGVYHDGRFAKLDDVVKHYDATMCSFATRVTT